MTMDNGTSPVSLQDGFVEQVNQKGQLISRGYLKNGERTGIWWFYRNDGSAFVGLVDDEGELMNHNIAYLYPDRWTALVGDFVNRKLKAAKLAYLQKVVDGKPEFSIQPSGITYTLEESTSTKICDNPLLPDPYESERVYVKKSNIDGANEGLFSKLEVKPGVIMAFYNGVRLLPDQVENRDWSQNGYTMLLNNDIILDIPPSLVNLKNYCATLGHKANHSFTPNCVCDNFEHPRFGPIIALQTTKFVKKDEELTINYGYGPMELGEDIDVPEWFKGQIPFYEQHAKEIKLFKQFCDS